MLVGGKTQNRYRAKIAKLDSWQLVSCSGKFGREGEETDKLKHILRIRSVIFRPFESCAVIERTVLNQFFERESELAEAELADVRLRLRWPPVVASKSSSPTLCQVNHLQLHLLWSPPHQDLPHTSTGEEGWSGSWRLIRKQEAGRGVETLWQLGPWSWESWRRLRSGGFRRSVIGCPVSIHFPIPNPDRTLLVKKF